MFEGAFSFRGRIGRLPFFLNGLVLALACGVGAVVLAFLIFPARRDGVGIAFFAVCMLIAAIAVGWFSLSLHVRRIRDIGWNPLIVIVGWVALNVADRVVALAVPALGAGHNHGTYIGALVNLALSLSLLFWPGRDEDAATTTKRVAPLEIAPRPLLQAPRTAGPRTFGRRGGR